jgi:hypothetical protein
VTVDLPSVPRSYKRRVRRVAILVMGLTVVLIGLLAFVMPLVPGAFLIPAGLAILATEFLWAKRLMERGKVGLKDFGGWFRRHWPFGGRAKRHK